MSPEETLMVLGPVIITAILGPTLMVVMNRAQNRAQKEVLEVQADKLRFEEMDLLITQLRAEVARLQGVIAELRKEIYALNRELRRKDRLPPPHEHEHQDDREQD